MPDSPYKKPYSLGIVIGRFQTLHRGHGDIIEKAVMLSERAAVFVGSSQESGTRANPFSYEQRRGMLKAVFGDSLEVYPLPDIGVGNNSRWGEYVLERIRESCGCLPDLMVSGKENRRTSWFTGTEGENIAELYVPKTIEISASAMRGFLERDERTLWESYTYPALYDMYEELRTAVISSLDNTETASI